MKPPFASNVDCAYTAGIIDGEGHVTARIRTGPKGGLDYIVTVANTDKAMIDWLHGLWGGSVHTYPQREAHHRQQWTWKLHSRQAAAMLHQVTPFLITKCRQAQIVLQLSATVERVGRRGYPAEVWAVRHELVSEMAGLNRRGAR